MLGELFMETETRNVGIMIAVVITAIIVILLVLFIRPRDTVRVEVDKNALTSLETRMNNLEAKTSSLDTRINDLSGTDTSIQDTIAKLDDLVKKTRDEVGQLRASFTTVIVIGIIIFIILGGLAIRYVLKSGKFHIGKNKSEETNIGAFFDEHTESTQNIENDEFFDNIHGTLDNLSSKEKKSALNDPFKPNKE